MKMNVVKNVNTMMIRQKAIVRGVQPIVPANTACFMAGQRVGQRKKIGGP